MDYSYRKGQKVIIYGAGYPGYEFLMKLQADGLEVSAFIDRNAENLTPKSDIPIYTLDSVPIPPAKRTEYIVIIAIKDIYTHEEVYEDLCQAGFVNVCYKKDPMHGVLGQRMSFYDLFTMSIYFDLDIFGKQMLEESSANFLSDQFSFAYLNADIVFSPLARESYLKNTQEHIFSDKSIFYKQTYFGFYSAFSKGIVNTPYWESFISDYYKMVSNSSFSKSDEEFQKAMAWHLRSKYRCFLEMESMLEKEGEYFENNPVYVKRNDNGYFNILDGSNRASFLIAKGLQNIPCLMTRKDYDKYINRPYAEKLSELIKIKQVKIRYPVLHTNFENTLNIDNRYYLDFMHEVLLYLGSLDFELKNQKVIDLYGNSGFFARYFDRLGALSDVVAKDDTDESLNDILNKLLYSESKSIDAKDLELAKYNIALLPYEELIADLTKYTSQIQNYIFSIGPEDIYDNPAITPLKTILTGDGIKKILAIDCTKLG